MRTPMDLARYKASVSKGLHVPPGITLHKAMPVSIEGAGDRRKLFTISTAGVDRDNDTIAVGGWDLDAYMRNPIVLYGHESYNPPVGRSVEIGLDGDALKAVVEFVPADMPIVGEMAEMCCRMVDLGFLRAASVGFRPIAYTIAKDRMDEDDWWPAMDFTKQELLEWSIVTIPANPEATVIEEQRQLRDDSARKAAEAAQAAETARIQRQLANLDRRRLLRAACY